MPDLTPDLDAIRKRLEDTPKPTSIGFASARANAHLDQSQADVAALMAWGEHLHAQISEAREQLADMAANAVDTHGIDPYTARRVRDALLEILGEDGGEGDGR